HDLAGRGWFHVSGSDRGRRVHDDYGCAALRGFPHNLLGQKLRSLVMADHVGDCDGRVLLARRAVRGNADRGNTARVYDALHAGMPGGLEDIASALDVGLVELAGIRYAQAVICCYVE